MSVTIDSTLVRDEHPCFWRRPTVRRSHFCGSARDRVGAFVKQHFTALFPPYQDRDGNTIEFWKLKKAYFGTILDKEGRLTIVPGSRILNLLNPKESSIAFLERIKKIPVEFWDFVYCAGKREISVVPNLRAAGHDGPLPFHENPGQREHTFRPARGHVRDTPQNRALIQSATVNQSYCAGRDRHGNDIYFRKLSDGRQAWASARDGKIRNGGISDKPAHLNGLRKEVDRYPNRFAELDKPEQRKNAPRGRDLTQPRQLAEKTGRVWAQRFGGDSGPGGGRGGPPSGGGKDPSAQGFRQILQQTRLTDSFNGTHRQNPVPAKAGAGGDIGGVACGTDYIYGLFEDPESLFESDHCFCMPITEGGRVPFTEQQLQQILRELAIGVYAHNTIPFFSLHFRQDGADLFPVIHPAYQNTLVGRVIGMLDYFMKGYLNGGVFTEAFVDDWYKNQHRKDPSSSLEHMIDFEKYCKENLEESDKKYKSAKALKEEPEFRLSMQEESEEEAVVSMVKKFAELCGLDGGLSALSRFNGFGNSFRIIAKQKSIQKQGDLFVIDSDFDVLYTIAPPSEYERLRERYIREIGEKPPPYKDLVDVYEKMRQKIHDHMVKMPLCQDYFSMLGVINFFSGYFSTLKKHRKVPVLFPIQQVDQRGCPPLFPHLPIKIFAKEALQINIRQALRECVNTNRAELASYFSEFFRYLLFSEDPSTKVFCSRQHGCDVVEILSSAILNNVFSLCTPPFRRFLTDDCGRDKLKPLAKKQAVQLRDAMCESIEEVVKRDRENPQFSAHNVPIDRAVAGTLDALPESCPDGSEPFCDPIPYEAMAVHGELAPEQVQINKGIVGGCGMELTVQKPQPSRAAACVLEHSREALQATQPESWQEVDMGSGAKGMAFRMPFEDVPAWLVDNYAWMGALLLTQEDIGSEDLERREQIFQAMQAGDHEEFKRCIDSLPDFKKIRGDGGVPLLHIASREEDPFYAQCLLERRCSPRAVDPNGYVPLHYAAMRGAVNTMKLLLSKDKAARNIVSKHGDSPLITAIQHGQLEAVQLLIAEGPKPSLLSSGYMDLHCALHEGNPEIIRAVMACDALVLQAINVCSKEGGTPLMLACALGLLEFVLALLEKGADAKIEREDGGTALEIAVRMGNIPIVEVLLKKTIPSPSTIEVALKQATVEMAALLSKSTVFVKYKSMSKDNPLHLSLRHGNIAVANHLTGYPALFHDENIEGDTPLHLAAMVGAWDVVEKLHDKGVAANLEKLLSIGYHPVMKKIFHAASVPSQQLPIFLLTALQAGNYLAISYVLQPLGARLDSVVGPTGWTALHYLARANGIFLFRSEICKAESVLLPLPDEGNKTLAYIAAENGSRDVFSFLLEQMKEEGLSLSNHYCDRHLLYGVMMSGNLEMVKEIVEMFPELVHVEIDSQKTLPVHLAARLGHIKMVRFLDEKGASFVERDSHLRTPLYYAIRVQGEKIVKFLLGKRGSIGAQELLIATKKDEMFTRLLKENPSQQTLDGALYQAVDAHDMDAFMKLRGAGASFSHCTPDGWTPTLRASFFGEQGMLEEILKEQPIDVREIEGNTALHMACLQGHAKCAELLVRAGFCPEQPNGSGQSALDISQGTRILKNALSKEEDSEVDSAITEFTNALFLLGNENANGSLESFSEDKMSLFGAIEKLGKVKDVLPKLPKDERVDIEAMGQKVWGTPLQLLVRFHPMFEILGDFYQFFPYLPSDPNIADSQGETLAHLLLRRGGSPIGIEGIRFDIPNHRGQTPLHIAAGSRDDKILEEILEAVPKSALEVEDNEGMTPLFYALMEKMKDESKSNDKMDRLIESGVNLGHMDHQLRTPLVLAVGKSLLSVVRLFVEKGADINQVVTLAGVSPLHSSIVTGDKEIFRHLLFNGADPNRLIDGGTHSMHLAAEKGETDVMAMLAARGVSFDVQDLQGTQPKHQAATHGETDVLEMIRRLQVDDATASMDTPREFLDEDQDRKGLLEGATPMQLAAFGGHSETVAWFLKNHADSEAKNKNGMNVLSFAANGVAAPAVLKQFEPYRIMQEPKAVLPALVAAIYKDNLEGMKYLYRHGVSIHVPLIESETGLHYACRSGALECTAWLLQNGADPTRDNTESKNAFELSVAQPSAEQFQLLLDYTQIDPNDLQHNTHTLLHSAAEAGQLKNMMLLLIRGATIDIVDSAGRTPLHIAVAFGHLDLVRLLLACEANMQTKDRDEKVPMDLVDEEGKIELEELFSEFERVKAERKEGDSRLHFAVRCKHPLAVLTLAQTENIEQKNCEGQTALQLALHNGETELSRLLRLGARYIEI